jgi:hypothetical protein
MLLTISPVGASKPIGKAECIHLCAFVIGIPGNLSFTINILTLGSTPVMPVICAGFAEGKLMSRACLLARSSEIPPSYLCSSDLGGLGAEPQGWTFFEHLIFRPLDS